MVYTPIAAGRIDQDSPGDEDLMLDMRSNDLDLEAQAAALHELYLNQFVHHLYTGESALTLGVGWNPTGMAKVVDLAAHAIPAGDELHNLAAPPAFAAASGYVYWPFLAVDAGCPNEDGILIRALRATPAMLKAVLFGENRTGIPPTGNCSFRIWKVPLAGQSAAITAAFDTISDTEITAGKQSLLSDALFLKYKNRDEFLNQLELSEHDAAGVHKMGLQHLNLTTMLNRQTIVADPAGPAQQTWALDWGSSVTVGYVFLELFADGAGDTELDLWLGLDNLGAGLLVADLVAGGTVTSNYQVTAYKLLG